MLLEGRVPTAQEAIQYFKKMAAGQLHRTRGKKKKQTRTSTLTGAWGGGTRKYYEKNPLSGTWGVRNRPYPNVKLVTPVAMNVEQAKSKLRRLGQSVTGKKRKRPTKGVKGGNKPKKRKTVVIQGGGKRKRSQSKSRRGGRQSKSQRGGRQYRDNFS
jgi:hypothetical protein